MKTLPQFIYHAAFPFRKYFTIQMLIIFSGLHFFAAGLWAFSDWCFIQYSAQFKARITELLLKRASKFPYSFYQNNPQGVVMSKINDLTALIPNVIATSMFQIFQFVITVMISLVFLARIHIALALIIVTWIIVFLFKSYFGLGKIDGLTAEFTEARAKTNGYVADYLGNILNVLTFSRQKFEANQLRILNTETIEKNQAYQYFNLKFYFYQGVVLSVYFSVFLSLALYFNFLHLITVGDFILVYMLNSAIIDRLFELSHNLRNFFTEIGTMTQSYKIFEETIIVEDRPGAKNLTITRGEIVFRDVDFCYQNASPLFKDLLVIIPAKQKVGLVGYSGGGKSTFINLILRLFEANSGQILIDNNDISEVKQESLREAISYIPQMPMIFHRSIKENIAYGKIDASKEEIIKAAKAADAHEFIMHLKEGYDSLVGERGVKLSGGQLQRIALARAMIKNTKILILDEATSALDSVTENQVQGALFKLMDNKTIIISAHRLSTLLHMDRLLVFEKGKIVQDGSHAELIKQDGLYLKLWQAQVDGMLSEVSEDDV